MRQSDNHVLPSGKLSRLKRRVILVFVVVLVVGGVYLVLSQMSNRLTLINDSSEHRTVGQVYVGTYFDSISHLSGQRQLRTSLAEDHVLPPHTRLTLTFRGRRHCHVVVVKEGNLKEDRMRTLRMSASWGSRWTIGWDSESEEIWDGEPSTLRRWFDSTSSWLPLPTSWRE